MLLMAAECVVGLAFVGHNAVVAVSMGSYHEAHPPRSPLTGITPSCSSSSCTRRGFGTTTEARWLRRTWNALAAHSVAATGAPYLAAREEGG